MLSSRLLFGLLAAALFGLMLVLPSTATTVTDTTDAPFADALQTAYATQEVTAVRDLLRRVETRTQEWMTRYRLYPLTEDEDVLGDPPSDPDDVDDATPMELALLSGVWAYKAGETNMFNAIRYGRRSVDFLEAARRLDPDDPYVLLVGGQSFLFRPSIAGKDVPKAVDRFERLVDALEQAPDTTPGLSITEARTWLWLALRERGDEERARALHEQIVAARPPVLYQKFLDDPPEV